MDVNGVATAPSTDGASSTHHARGHRPLPDEVVKALADKLGMSADDLKTKLQAGGDGRKVLDQLAEEKGISKQELRETIRSAMPAHAGEGGPRPPRGEGISFDGEVGPKLLSTLADKLGTTADDLKAKVDGGAKLGDLLKANGLSHEDVRAAFEQAFTSWKEYGSSGSATSTAPADVNAVDVQV